MMALSFCVTFGLHGGQVLCCGSPDGQLDKKENMVSSAFSSLLLLSSC